MVDLPLLDALDQRILGALMEKQVTVPATYPLTLNALRTACNQANSRDPVTAYDDATLEWGAKSLKERGLLRIVWADRGPRTLKYHQVLTEEVDLDVAEAAILTVMLLRGPQAPGELKTRCERQHAFTDRHAVEAVLARMSERGLVRQLPREHGQRDARWVHLMGSQAQATGEESVPEADPLAGGPEARDDRVRRTYGLVAQGYADDHRNPFDDLPLDRMLLDRVAHEAGNRPIADVGTGSGAAAGYLHERGVTVRGFDLTPEMVEQARAAVPGVEFAVGDLRRLLKPVDADGWGAITAWYSLIHLAPAELPEAVVALARTLASRGVLALAVQTGATHRHLTEAWGRDDLDLTMVRHRPEAVAAALAGAGLIEVELITRTRQEWRGEQTDRLYALGRKP